MSLPKPGVFNILSRVPTTYYDLLNYTSSWPFTEDTRCVTKGHGKVYEIQLNHRVRRFEYVHTDGSTIVDSTPTGILTKMALMYRCLPLSTARSNWSNIWLTRNDGVSYVSGLMLRRSYAKFYQKPLLETIRYDIPNE